MIDTNLSYADVTLLPEEEQDVIFAQWENEATQVQLDIENGVRHYCGCILCSCNCPPENIKEDPPEESPYGLWSDLGNPIDWSKIEAIS